MAAAMISVAINATITCRSSIVIVALLSSTLSNSLWAQGNASEYRASRSARFVAK
jgi:hypothetical protein